MRFFMSHGSLNPKIKSKFILCSLSTDSHEREYKYRTPFQCFRNHSSNLSSRIGIVTPFLTDATRTCTTIVTLDIAASPESKLITSSLKFDLLTPTLLSSHTVSQAVPALRHVDNITCRSRHTGTHKNRS